MNPFKPTAGKMPPVLVGRQNIIEDFQEALDNGAGAPGRLMLIMGQRGYGKTSCSPSCAVSQSSTAG